jgi:hypothetical protein
VAIIYSCDDGSDDDERERRRARTCTDASDTLSVATDFFHSSVLQTAVIAKGVHQSFENALIVKNESK